MRRVFGLILFFAGLFLLIDSNITGAVVGSWQVANGLWHLVGLILMLVGGVLFVFGDGGLEKRVKRDSNINSFRRFLKRTKDYEVSYEDAKNLYQKLEKKYWTAVSKGRIKKSNKNPLEFIEQYIKSHKIPETREIKPIIVTESYKKHKNLEKLSEEAKENQDVERGLNTLRKQLEKGNIAGAGIGAKHIPDTSGVKEMRHKCGARLYILETGEYSVDIVGESSKDEQNQQGVIKILKKLYPKKK